MTHNGILYSEKSDLLNNHQKSFLLQQVGKKYRDPHPDIM